MAVYRFRVCLEDNEDIIRDIDIKSSQNFEQFHNAIQEAFKFDNKHAASFFVSDDYWRKNREITLRKEDLPLEPEEIRQGVETKKLMVDTKIASFIEQPHQRFIYVFDATAQWNFLVEMVKLVDENNKLNYPACVRVVGNAPKQYKQINKIQEEEINSKDPLLAAILGNTDPSDDEIYKKLDTGEEGVEQDDLDNLEGEEGEDEFNEEEDEFSSEGDDNENYSEDENRSNSYD
jgi:hypothetical protein